MISESLIGAEDIAALHPTGHQHPVRVLYDAVCDHLLFIGGMLFQTLYGLVGPSTFRNIRYDRVSIWIVSHIRADDYSDVIEFQALAGVDAPGLLYRIGIYGPCIGGSEIQFIRSILFSIPKSLLRVWRLSYEDFGKYEFSIWVEFELYVGCNLENRFYGIEGLTTCI